MTDYKKYENYKKTNIDWLDEIPSNWDMLPNRAIFKERITRNCDNEELLSVTIKNGVIRQAQLLKNSSKKDSSNEDKSKYKLVKINDIAYNKMRMWQGALGVSDYQGIVSPAYVILNPRANINSKYYHYLYRSPKYVRYSYNYSYGICDDQLSLRYKDFSKMYSIVPPIDEQDKIVSFIEYKEKQINKLIKKQKKLIKLLEEKKKIIISNIITKGLDGSVPMKDSGIDYIGFIPKHWEVGKVKQYYKIITGFTPDTKQIGYYDDINGQNWVTISDINGKYTPDSTNRKISEKFIKLKHPKQTPKGSLLYSFKLSVGQVAFAKENIYTNEAIASFLDSDKCCLPFLFYSSSLIVNNANVNIYGAKILNQNLIKNAFIVFPPLNEQKLISDYLDKKCELIEKMIYNKNSLIYKLEEYKKNLIALTITGQIDVRDYVTSDNIEEDIEIEESEILEEELCEVEYANN